MHHFRFITLKYIPKISFRNISDDWKICPSRVHIQSLQCETLFTWMLRATDTVGLCKHHETLTVIYLSDVFATCISRPATAEIGAYLHAGGRAHHPDIPSPAWPAPPPACSPALDLRFCTSASG